MFFVKFSFFFVFFLTGIWVRREGLPYTTYLQIVSVYFTQKILDSYDSCNWWRTQVVKLLHDNKIAWKTISKESKHEEQVLQRCY